MEGEAEPGEVRSEWRSSRGCRQPPELEQQRALLLSGLWREHAMRTPGLQTSNLHNYPRINFCCFKPPGLWHFYYNNPRKPYSLKVFLEKKEVNWFFVRQSESSH